MIRIVQKYGGTSIGNANRIKNVANRVSKNTSLGQQVIVVVSAMGDTTDQLLSIANQVSNSPDPRELDILLSTGESVSSSLLAMALRSIGIEAISLSGFQAGIRTDSTHGKARINHVDTARLERELTLNKVVIVAGFQGVTADMDITTLGRGASDTTAVALAAALGAKRCEIFTDVEGIYTADPRVVSNAKKLKEIDYEEMLELASLGAKMNPRSIELGSIYRVPIYVTSSLVDSQGTLIHEGAKNMEKRKKVTGVAYDLDVAKITIRGVPDRPGIAATIFEPLVRESISVDTIVQNASIEKLTDLSFTIERSDLQKALDVINPVIQDVGGNRVTSDNRLGKVGVVGSGMQNSSGYAARMFRALSNEGINIEMITTSDIRITCIVAEDKIKDAVNALHTAFELEKP